MYQILTNIINRFQSNLVDPLSIYCDINFREQQAVKVPTPTETTENSICFNNSENINLFDKESKGVIKSINGEISTRTLPILALNEVNNLKVIREEQN